jgi:methanol metabolism-related c-type cytochrome
MWRTSGQTFAKQSSRREKPVRIDFLLVALAFGALILTGSAADADGSGDPKAVRSEDGKYYDKDGTPTYNIKDDGTVDWYTYSGYRRYHSECHVCHGPDGEGSTYAPGVKNSLKTMTYAEFFEVVVNGRKRTTPAGADSVMPSLGLNANVMCYLDDIYVYLRARANDAVGRARPEKREQKPQSATEAERTCLGEKG